MKLRGEKTYLNKTKTTKAFVLVFALLSFVSLSFSTFNKALASDITSENIIKAVNNERTSRGLNSLTENTKLDSAALNKSNHMLKNNYFDHYGFGLTPWNFIKAENYNYSIAGENLALGFNTSEGVVSAWMKSDKHRENILNPDFKDIGVGVVKGEFNDKNIAEGEVTVTTEMFGTEKPAIEKLFDKIIKVFNIF